jgi:anti-anti-sigma factor
VQLSTRIDDVAGSIVVAVDGIVDLSTVGRLHDDLARALRQHPGVSLIVDLDAVGGLDDTGLGVLLGAAAAARNAGGDLQVVCTRPALLARLTHTRFDRAVDVRSTIT